MFKYSLLRNAEIIVVCHYGKYVGAEADEAMLSILGKLTLAERRQLKYVIQDFFAVEEMSLHDTDVARRMGFFRKLSKLYQTQNLEETLASIGIYQILPERNDILAILNERGRKLGDYNAAKINLLPRTSLAETLLEIGEGKVPSEKDWLGPSDT